MGIVRDLASDAQRIWNSSMIQLHHQVVGMLYQRHSGHLLWCSRRPSFTKGYCDIGFCFGTLVFNSRRPSFISKPCDCCINGIAPAICSGPGRPNFTKGYCDIGFCFGTLVFNSRRPSFISRQATAVSTALLLPFALGQEGPTSPEDTAISDSVVVLCFTIPRGRASPAGLATAATSALVVSSSPGRKRRSHT